MRTLDFLRSSPPEITQAQPAVVHLVDNDPAVRATLGHLLPGHSYQVRAYASAEEFLDVFDGATPGCLLLDIGVPGMGGLELHRRLREAGVVPPTVFTAGSADVATCATAMRMGALHFLTKPIDVATLLNVLEEATRQDAALRQERRQRLLVESRMARLTPREREVLGHVMQGRLNKQISWDLGTAEKTVKVHRARAMEKMGVRSVAELVRLVERASPAPEGGQDSGFSALPVAPRRPSGNFGASAA
jgi:FixJ family two-component response regulator